MKMKSKYRKLLKRVSSPAIVSFMLLLMVVGLLTGCQKQGNESVNESIVTEAAEEGENEDIFDNIGGETEAPTADLTVMEATDMLQAVSEDTVVSEEIETASAEADRGNVLKTSDGKTIVDLIMFMGQSNMSGCGGDAAQAPKVEEGTAYEFRAISDPTRLYQITEPFGINENQIGGIIEYPGGKKGSLVSSFAIEYFKETGVPIVAVSASVGATTTEYWTRTAIVNDFVERHERAVVWMESNDYSIRHQYVIWLQGESDADEGITVSEYSTNMDNIIRPLFIKGIQKVFIIRPGRVMSKEDYFDDVISAQTEMCKDSSYYALASTLLSGYDTSYMTDEWHYGQVALNYLGTDAGKNVAYFTNHDQEPCLYDYKYENTYIPDGYDYPSDTKVTPITIEPLKKADE